MSCLVLYCIVLYCIVLYCIVSVYEWQEEWQIDTIYIYIYIYIAHTRFLYLLINQAQGLDVGMALEHVDS